jgi:hypothetical protein
VEVIGLGLVLFEGLLPAVAFDADELTVDALGPATEIVDLATYLLLPGAAGVGRKGEFADGFSE